MITNIEKRLDKTYNIDKAQRAQYKRKETAMKNIVYINADYGKLSQHFKAKEFQCKDGNKKLLICKELLTILETIREHFKAPVKINSGYRTPSWNSKVNGAPNSMHCKGMAADIVVKGHSSQEVAKYADSIMEQGGVIKYTNFVHIDVREERYRKGV
jgi:uncharacterized protein YcbK (DUF882 family)